MSPKFRSLAIRGLWVALLFVAVLGCKDVAFEAPVGPVSQAADLSKIYGYYRFSVPWVEGLNKNREDDSESKAYNGIHIGSAGKGFPENFVKVVLVANLKELQVNSYFGYGIIIDGEMFFSTAVPKDQDKDVTLTKWHDFSIDSWRLFRMSENKSGLDISCLKFEKVKGMIDNQFLKGHVSGEDLIVESNTKALAKFFASKRSEELFSQSDALLKRIH